MQDEINSKIVALSIRTAENGTRMTAKLLQAAIRQYLKEHEKAKTADPYVHGKQTVSSLMKQNVQLTNIEVTDQNIRSFERIARKYNIDFALKKDIAADPPRYLVFFKAKDVDVMTAAFKEYSASQLPRKTKPSVHRKLEQALQKVQTLHLDHVREKERGLER